MLVLPLRAPGGTCKCNWEQLLSSYVLLCPLIIPRVLEPLITPVSSAPEVDAALLVLPMSGSCLCNGGTMRRPGAAESTQTRPPLL